MLLQKGGPGRTRTYEGYCQRIYSPPPLPLGTLTQVYDDLIVGTEPTMGFEPITYALQKHCSAVELRWHVSPNVNEGVFFATPDCKYNNSAGFVNRKSPSFCFFAVTGYFGELFHGSDYRARPRSIIRHAWCFPFPIGNRRGMGLQPGLIQSVAANKMSFYDRGKHNGGERFR